MKKIIALVAMTMLVSGVATGQKTQKFTADKNNEYGLTYSLPLTVVDFEVTACHTVSKAGPYAKYAKKYLGITDVISEDSRTWQLVDVKMSERGEADHAHKYLMQFKSGQTPFIICSDDGRLLAINDDSVTEQTKSEEDGNKREKRHSTPAMSALTGDILASQSTAKRAELAAQQIYKIRQSRNDYMTGEADQMPDGEALKIIMKRLDEQEAALTEMFTGSSTTEQITRTFTFTPDGEDGREVICRISDLNGVVEKDDLSGEPVYASFKTVDAPVMPVNDKGEEKKLPKDAVIYNIPGRVNVVVTYQGEKKLDQNFDCAQVGIQFGLDPDRFADKKQPAYLRLSPATGGIVEMGVK